MKVITAKNGQTLRDFAESTKMLTDQRVAYFPETQLSPLEQQEWVSLNQGKFDEVITFSAFIISDSENVTILDETEDEAHDVCRIKFGDSINKITMNIWSRMTIGKVAEEKLKQYRQDMEEVTTQDQLDQIISDADRSLGDSVEKVLLIKTAFDKEF